MKIIGRKLVLEALQSGKAIQRLMILQGAGGRIIGEILSEAKRQGVRVDRIPPDRTTRELGSGNHQGVAALISPVNLYSLSDLDGKRLPIRYNLLVALDRVTDPYHLGAIARNALGAGCDGLILPDRRTAPVTDVAVKASAGALLHLPLIRVRNLADTLEELKNRKWWVFGTAGKGARVLWEQDLPDHIVLVFGSEGKGISSRVLQICDDLLNIPLQDSLESLSVSSAAGVFLFEITRQRRCT